MSATRGVALIPFLFSLSSGFGSTAHHRFFDGQTEALAGKAMRFQHEVLLKRQQIRKIYGTPVESFNS